MSKHFYVYYSYEEFGRGYIGSRGCKCLPEEDFKYYGSFRDKNFNPTQKIILGVYESRKDAYEAEILLHEFYDVARNPHFANRCKQTSTKFSMSGVKLSEETKRKMGASRKGRKHSKITKQKMKNSAIGKKLKEETKNKIKNSKLGKKTKPHTQESIEKMRLSKLGRKRTEEEKKKIKEGCKNKIYDERYIENLKQKMKGNDLSVNYNKVYTLKSPEGKIYKFSHISQFCREHDNISRFGIYQMRVKKVTHYKGWKLLKFEELPTPNNTTPTTP